MDQPAAVQTLGTSFRFKPVGRDLQELLFGWHTSLDDIYNYEDYLDKLATLIDAYGIPIRRDCTLMVQYRVAQAIGQDIVENSKLEDLARSFIEFV
jgi:hypothetical protein